MAKKLDYPYVLIVIAAIARLIPHPWNFTPIGAVGLFAGAYCQPRHAWQVPIVVLLVTDIFIGFYNPIILASVYLGFAFTPLIGRLLLNKRRSVVRIGAGVWISATVFFVISNFGVWLAAYPQTLAGFIECYTRALPFYGASLIGDTIYAAVLFGGYEALPQLSQRLAHVLQK